MPIERISAHDNNDETKSLGGEKMSDRYSEWKHLTTLADRKWQSENQIDGAAVSKPKPLKESVESVSSERIFELIGQYDNGESMAICQEELVSIFWEVLQQRKIIP